MEDAKLRAWAEAAVLLLRDLLPLMAAIGRYERWTVEQRETLGQLLSASARSSESALLLAAFGQLWDAEVLVRSVAEGTLKVCYLLQNQKTFDERYKEYSQDLWEIALLKDHRKAEQVLAALRNSSDLEWQPIRDQLLEQNERIRIEQAYPKDRRRALETKWGFTGITEALARSGDKMFSDFTAFAHGYSMASHVQHADYVGTAIPLERDRRSDERREAVHLAHATRLISDCFTFLQLRLIVGYRFVGADVRLVREAWKRVDVMLSGLKNAYDEWLAVEYPSP